MAKRSENAGIVALLPDFGTDNCQLRFLQIDFYISIKISENALHLGNSVI